jgi:hypothetical protein
MAASFGSSMPFLGWTLAAMATSHCLECGDWTGSLARLYCRPCDDEPGVMG